MFGKYAHTERSELVVNEEKWLKYCARYGEEMRKDTCPLDDEWECPSSYDVTHVTCETCWQDFLNQWEET
jgi:hypothetical protein